MEADQVDRRESRRRRQRRPPLGPPGEDDALSVDVADRAVARRAERPQAARVHLAGLARGVELAGERDHRAARARRRRRRGTDRIAEVARPVGVGLVGAALGAGQNDRCLGIQEPIDEVHSVTAVVGEVRASEDLIVVLQPERQQQKELKKKSGEVCF